MRNLSRRSFAGILGAAGFSAATHGLSATEVRTATGAPTGFATPDWGPPVNTTDLPGKLREPLISRSAAYRLAMLDPTTRDWFEEQVSKSCRRVDHIDPDIAVHKSISLAAKVCYQRQRNMEHERERLRVDLDDEWREQLPFYRFIDAMNIFQWGKPK